jgi:DNA-binding MarR family transcriptional regulator
MMTTSAADTTNEADATATGTTALGEIDEMAGRLRFAVARMARLLRQQDQSGFGPTFIAALATVGSHGPLTLGDLAAREQVAPPTITKVVEKLVANGLAERIADTTDRRVARVAITAKGAKQLQTYRTRRTEWLAQRLRDLDVDDRARLAAAVDVLEQLIAVPEDSA